MDSVAQNGWDQLRSFSFLPLLSSILTWIFRLTKHYVTSVALGLLYYDYALTFGRECNLFWSWKSFKRWGSILFFLNRYCGVIGHAPIFVELFTRPDSAFCKHLRAYHQFLAVVMQTIVAGTFIMRTYALYDRSRVVLIGLISIALAGFGTGIFLVAEGGQSSVTLVLPDESTGCVTGLSKSQGWRLAVLWGAVVAFDLIVVVMTLVKVVPINRTTGGSHTLTSLLVRDGLVYFGLIGLVSLANIITFLYGSEITRGVATTVANTLSCVLLSRFMFNLREPREYSIQLEQQSPVPLRVRRWRCFSGTHADERGESQRGSVSLVRE